MLASWPLRLPWSCVVEVVLLLVAAVDARFAEPARPATAPPPALPVSTTPRAVLLLPPKPRPPLRSIDNVGKPYKKKQHLNNTISDSK
jgi:hypothetical protein